MSFAVLLISMKLIHYMKSIACRRGNASDNYSTVAQWLEHRSAESEGMRFDTRYTIHARDKTKTTAVSALKFFVSF